MLPTEVVLEFRVLVLENHELVIHYCGSNFARFRGVIVQTIRLSEAYHSSAAILAYFCACLLLRAISLVARVVLSNS